jgi:two-component system nitrate/nitrite response regulator NarL
VYLTTPNAGGVTADAAPRTAVVDAETITRQALPLLLPGLPFTAPFDTVGAFLHCAPPADVVLMDPSVPTTDGDRLDGVRSVVGAGYRVCLYTAERNRMVLIAGLNAGARGIVHKSDSMSYLDAALRRVVQGELVLTHALTGLAELADLRHLLPRLTRRQHQVLAGRARGEKFETIAGRLFITRKVAEEHWAAVVAKFGNFLREHSPADLERLLGLDPVDLLAAYPVLPQLPGSSGRRRSA